MIPVKYRQLGIALVTKSSSLIRRALPVVTWPSHDTSQVAPLRQEAAPPAASPSPATTAEGTLALAATHLEYLGYEVQLDPEGWSHARHPYRFDFQLRAFPIGIRLHCSIGIGAAIGNSRAAWLDFLNTANDRGHIAQFSLFEDSMGRHGVRMCAFVSGSYDRKVFATAMDLWRDDLDLVRHKPEFLDKPAARGDGGASVTVN